MSRAFFVVIGCALLSAAAALPTWQSPEVTPWPKPRAFMNGTAAVEIGQLSLATTSKSALLQKAFARVQAAVAQLPPSPMGMDATSTDGKLTQVHVTLSTDDETLNDKTNETYSLKVTSGASASVEITAANVFGAMHAMESLLHLGEEQDSGKRVIRGCPWSIDDSPRFVHRAILVDTARHFLPMSSLQTMVDAMAMVKLNVLHWHLVDSQAFPFNSSAAPDLGKGAWNWRETYSPDDLKGLVQYAKERGVRIMVEIDTPGHSASWRFGYPEVVADCPDVIAANDANAALDPSNEQTFDVLAKLMSELAGIFPDTYFHLGGDEVSYRCWEASQRVTDFMTKMGFSDYSQLQQYYQNRLLNITATALKDKTLVIYQDTFDDGVVLPKSIVFDAWKAGPSKNVLEEMVKLVKAGYRTILANGPNGEWYLNDGFGNGDHVSLWADIYSVDPLNVAETLTPAEQALILGGEVSLWAEEINENNIIFKAWPRSGAFAERMWSPEYVSDANEAAPRITRLYCRLTFRGVPASPVSPGSCYHR